MLKSLLFCDGVVIVNLCVVSVACLGETTEVNFVVSSFSGVFSLGFEILSGVVSSLKNAAGADFEGE